MAQNTYCSAARKRRFRDHAEAVRALHRAHNARQEARLTDGSTRRREKRSYRCVACNGWHLTSQERYAVRGDHTSEAASPGTPHGVLSLCVAGDPWGTRGFLHPLGDLVGDARPKGFEPLTF